MTVNNLAPNTDNYFIGKGTVEFQKEGESGYRDVGNVAEFEVTPDVTKLDHYSSREGTRTKDRSVVTERSLTVRMVMEEFNADNLAMMLLGTVTDVSGDVKQIDIFAVNSVKGALKFTGTNDVGPKWTLEFPSVEFTPSDSFSPISDEWGQMEVTGEVLLSGGIFGTASAVLPEVDSP
jgi:hypothetical protein